ncbi:MAG: transposase [Actinomycetota bacterium]|nr:transposase [Actinomycetota bacterium]
MDKRAGKNPSQKRYPKELKDRAVRMVAELRREDPGDTSVVSRVARQLGIGTESLRQWLKQAEVDAGTRGGLSTTEHEELRTLRRENKELRRANDIPRAAATFFFLRRGARPPTEEIVAFVDAHRDTTTGPRRVPPPLQPGQVPPIA